jgi:NAD(P)-dependent dehydrogenase (short-subunit alcohol dehydrogenase family)
MRIGPSVALVTGGSRGIGEASVRAFLEEGYRFATCVRHMRHERTDRSPAVSGDMADLEFAADMVEVATARFGRVDTLVDDVGAFVARAFVEYDQDDISTILRTDIYGFLDVGQSTLREMARRDSGHIVNVTSSLVVDRSLTKLPAALTALTKGGLDTVARALAMEYADRNIRVNAVAPGVVRTPEHLPERLDAFAALHPPGRIAEPDEIAEAVLCLERASFVTGEVLRFDGEAHAGR